MRGYVAVTDPKWFDFQSRKNRKRVLFWRHSETPVDLDEGDYFFFLIRGKLPRLIKGYGIVEKADSDEVKKMWDKYNDLMGYSSLEDLKRGLGKNDKDKVAHYILKYVEYIRDSTITDADIDFDRSIMAGKIISQPDFDFLKENLVSKRN